MHAIIPVAGIGTRLRPHTHTLPKVLVNVAGKPILGHILDALVAHGVKSATIVTGYKGELVEQYVRSSYHMDCAFVDQGEQLGLGHAIWTARKSLSGDPTLIILGDTIFDVDLSVLNTTETSAIGIKEVDDPRRFGVVVTDQLGFVTHLIEKPDTPVTNKAIVGLYYIKQSELLRECLDELISKDVRTKGEYQLTDALQLMVDKGEKMTTFNVEGWYDCGQHDTLLTTNRFLLDRLHVDVERTGCVVIPPVQIDTNAIVENSVVGPYTSIGRHAVLRNSIVQDSIVCDGATVSGIALRHSIIGANAEVHGQFVSINIGDNSVVDLGNTL